MKNLFAWISVMLLCAGVSAQQNISFSVDMNEYAGTFSGVYINATFNGWCGECAAMSDDDVDGVWDLDIQLPDGTYEFKFTVDGWSDQEIFTGDEECTTPPAEYVNRTLEVAGSDVDLATVCWNSCSACGGEEPAVDALVTFQIDMNGSEYPNVDYDNIVVNHSANGWAGWGVTLSDDDGDGIFSGTGAFTPNSSLEFVVAATGAVDGWGGWGVVFNAPVDCAVAGTANYGLELGNASSTPSVFEICAGGCETTCGVTNDPLIVSFSVDMNEYSGTFSGVYVNASFNGWCGECAPMTDDDVDGVWDLDLELPDGAYEFKFTLDGWSDQEMFTGAEECTTPPAAYVNRTLEVAGSDVDLATVCWNSCSACGEGAEPVDVTFSVDMNDYESAYGTVNLNSSFGGWCGECAPMTDDDADGVYSITASLLPGTYEYKFTTDGWNDQEEFAGGEECTSTIDGYTNRTITVTEATDIGVVCWNSCSTCDNAPSEVDVTFHIDMNSQDAPNADYDNIVVNHSANGWGGWGVTLFDDDGDGIFSGTGSFIENTSVEFVIAATGAPDGWSGWGVVFNAPEACEIPGTANYGFTVGTEAIVFEVCAGACETTCPVGPVGCTDEGAQNYDSEAAADDGSCQYLITLRVNMSNEMVSGDGVHVAGAFQDWDPGATALSYFGGYGVYEITLALANGSYEYKFVNGNAWGGEESVSGCGNGGNRVLVVEGADAVTDAFCFGSCEGCAGCLDPFSLEYNPFAGADDGSCATALAYGCIYEDASNYSPAANVDDGSCEFDASASCAGDLDGDGAVATSDLLAFLAAFGLACE